VSAASRHPAIVRAAEIEGAEPWGYEAHDEPMGYDADFSSHFGLRRMGLHEQRLLPGRRTSFPHAESDEDEFVYVIAGTPDVWLDGVLHPLAPGDAVGFPAGTGLAHSFLNNSDAEVRLLVAGDRGRQGSKVLYPVDAHRKPLREDWWHDAPVRERGPHDGLTDARRAEVRRRD
jgi:uncharacterized cupin superfamily protein